MPNSQSDNDAFCHSLKADAYLMGREFPKQMEVLKFIDLGSLELFVGLIAKTGNAISALIVRAHLSRVTLFKGNLPRFDAQSLVDVCHSNTY